MSLSERLAENVRACFSGIWIQSCEHEDALTEIARLCHSENWRFATWDIDQGLRISGQTEEGQPESAGADPLAAVRALGHLRDARAVPALVNLLEGDDWSLRMEAEVALLLITLRRNYDSPAAMRAWWRAHKDLAREKWLPAAMSVEVPERIPTGVGVPLAKRRLAKRRTAFCSSST